jgi:hypothetical protein
MRAFVSPDVGATPLPPAIAVTAIAVTG